MTWVVALIGSIAGFLFGYDEGVIAGSLDLVRNHFALNDTYVGMMAAALPFGALFSAITLSLFMRSKGLNHFGRRTLLSFVGFLFLCGALGVGLAESINVLIGSRVLLGIAIGVASVMTPLYLAETAPPKLRGAVVGIYQLAITIGIVSAYSANFLLVGQNAWRLLFASSALPALILCVGILFLPESPRWLCSRGYRDKAARALRRLRKGGIEDELNDIEMTLAEEPKNANLGLLFKKPLGPVLFLGMMLFCLQQLSGINVVIYFAPEIFKNLGLDNTAGQLLATVGIGIVNLVMTVVAILFMDKVGRRKLLMLGFAGTCISLFSLSSFSMHHVAGLPYISIGCIFLYICSFAISIGPVPHIAMSEIFPLHVRGAGMGLSALSNWGFNTLIIFSFPVLQSILGIEYLFAIYALVCALGLLFTYFYMPETKNLSLEHIEHHVMEGKPLRLLGRDGDLPGLKVNPVLN